MLAFERREKKRKDENKQIHSPNKAKTTQKTRNESDTCWKTTF
jgi:hypothetical protein